MHVVAVYWVAALLSVRHGYAVAGTKRAITCRLTLLGITGHNVVPALWRSGEVAD